MKHTLSYTDCYVLENDRVRMSCLNLEHIPMLREAAQNEEIWTYFLEKGNKDIDQYCQRALEHKQIESQYPLVIYDKLVNQFVGMTRLYDYDATLGNIKIGHTWIGKDFWGTQLNANCKFLLFEFAFESLGLQRIGFGVHGENLRSISAMNKVGCQQEGVLRSFLNSTEGHGRTDLILFSLLKHEWDTDIRKALTYKLLNQKNQN